jgi:LysM repeat protein
MALTPEQTKNSQQQVQSISQQTAQIQSGINTLASAEKAGLTITPQTTVQQAQAFTGAQPAPTQTATPPTTSPTTPQAGTQPIEQSPQEAGTYTVQPGDTLSGIAQAQGVNVAGISGYKSGDPNKIFPGEQLSLGDKYAQAKQRLDQSGVNPMTTGQGSAAVQTALQGIGGQAEPPSILGGIQETDNIFDSLFTQYDEFFAPLTQKTSLVEEYQNLSKSLGLEAINAELIDTKRIIDGTEDDIRSEITTAGGTASESQVLAMANARNKSLIKNYNYLLDTKNAAMTQLSTLMELTIADRNAASAEFDSKMNFAFKVAEFKERATTNARNIYMTLGEQMGWDTLLGSVSPYEQGVIQKTLGVSGNALQSLAQRSQQDRALAVQEQQLGLDIKRAQLSGLSLDNQKKIQGLIEEPTGVDDLYQQERSTRILQSVAELKGRVGRTTVGLFGSGLARVAGTPARDFKADLETIKSNIFSGELTAMRAASKTGGAVGNVSDKEGDKLQSALGALDQGQSVASFNRNLQQIEDSIVRWYEAIHGAGLSVAPDGSGNLIRITD